MRPMNRPGLLAAFAPLAAALALQAFGAAECRAGIIYKKEFYVPNVPAATKINGGAELQTWAGDPPANSTHTIKKPKLDVEYTHAKNRITQEFINGGFPVGPVAGKTAATGWAATKTAQDSHNQMNTAIANINVDPVVPGPIIVQMRFPAPNVPPIFLPLIDTVHTVIDGSVEAGVPADGDKLHSADSFAAVDLGLPGFPVVQGGAIPTISIFGRNTMIGGRFQTADNPLFNGKVVDPYYVTVNDLDTGESVTEAVMSLTLQYIGALFSVDDAGIRLTINRHDPTSFVELLFSSISDWVTTPYTYGARLSNLGFEGFGLTPTGDWTVTQTADTIEAFLAFGPGGMPFDGVEVRPPDSLFTPGHTYNYDAGASDGAFELAAAVPEPSTLSATGLGALIALGYARLRRPRREA